MAAGPVFRELVYRLVPKKGSEPPSLPLRLVHGTRSLNVETSACHLDDNGDVWRIMHVYGDPGELERAAKAFEAYEAKHVLEKTVLGATPRRLVLFYKYRPLTGVRGFSNTDLAFRILGRDTVITDGTRGEALTIRILSRHSAKLRTFFETVQRRAAGMYDVDLVYLGPPRGVENARLTPGEEAALQAALKLGYFGVPRKAGVRDVAKVLGLSASAASYRLRMAEKKLTTSYLAAV